MTYKFFDTSSLLKIAGSLFKTESQFKIVVSSVTLNELENIKTSQYKDLDVKFSARKVLQELNTHYGEYSLIVYKDEYLTPIIQDSFPINNDTKIISCAIFAKANLNNDDQLIFVSNDLLCRHIANFYLNVEEVLDDEFDYDGYKEVYLDEEQMADFYTNQYLNLFDLNINEYLLVYDKNEKKCVDRLCRTEDGYRRLNYGAFNSELLGDIKPLKGDLYQPLVADSLENNKITMIKGKAGSGKTTIALGFLFSKLQRGNINKIIVFCNTLATKNSAKLGLI